MFQYDLSIAGVNLRIQSQQRFPPNAAFAPFLVQNMTKPQYLVEYKPVQQLPPIPSKVVCEGQCDRFHADDNGGWVRSFFDAPHSTQPYAVGRYDYQNGQITIEYLEQGKHCVSEFSNSFFHLGVERLLMQEHKFCFHAALIRSHLGGILFSGPSGIGKSTQANLWCQYRGSVLLNGDRPILGKDREIWTGWGSPYAGSSACHVNESSPIRAIVLLKQTPQCSIRRLDLREGVRRIYAGLTVYSWEKAFAMAAFDFAAELASELPVYELCCTPDEAAVEMLEQTLQKELCL